MSAPRSLHSCGFTFMLRALALLAVLIAPQPSGAQPVPLPQSALLPSANPLCDSNLVPCLDIDEFAAHAYAHLMVLPHSAQRDSAAVIPYGISLGLLGRIAGGIATHYAFWQEGEASLRRYGQHGPLRLSLSALLWPLLPLRQAPMSEQHEDGESHFVPPRHLRIGLVYEHELRVGPFDGANQLGMLGDLAAIRLVATRTFGPIEITASAGALYDWRGTFATGEGAVQLGVYLPFFKALKLYGEALGRGGVAYVREGVVLQAREPDPLRAQGVLGLGLSFRPHARVDLGVSAQMGLGGLAQSAVIARFAVLSVGKTYQGRAATPIAQMAGDAAVHVAAQIREYIKSLPIDPVLDQTCAIHDDDGSLMGTFGTRTPDGRSCEKDGFRIRIGEHFDRPPASKDRICRDPKLTECVLELRGKEWVPIRRPRLDGTCMMYDRDGTPMGRYGEPTPDGEHCRYVDGTQRDAQGYPRVYERKIGQDFFTDAQRSRVCEDAEMQRCFMRASRGESLQLGPVARTAEAFLGGMQRRLEDRVAEAEESARTIGRVASDVAHGRVSVRTLGQAAVDRATQLAGEGSDYLQHPEKLKPILDQARAQVRAEWEEWKSKPLDEKVEAAASAAGSVVVDVGVRAGTGALKQAAGIGGKAPKAGAGEADAPKKGQLAGKAGHAAQDVAEPKAPAVHPSASPEGSPTGRHGAFKAAKRDAEIPKKQHPDRVYKEDMTDRNGKRILDEDGKPVSTRNYQYSRPGKDPVVIQDHGAGHQFKDGNPGNQGPHFNVRPIDNTRTGTVDGTKAHYPFKR